jgi:hypothetical protein
MPLPSPEHWTDCLKRTLGRYEAALLRQVAAKLIKPRNQWPVDELIERMSAAADNAPMIDRRLQDVSPAGRQLLAVFGHSRLPRWSLGNIVELACALGQEDGLKTIFELLEAGLLYPELGDRAGGKLKSFEQWLGQAGGGGLAVFVPPLIAARARGENLGLPECPGAVAIDRAPAEADGLEWLLRLAVLWQRVVGAPLRRTQGGEFFKRDLERLEQDGLLNGSPSDGLAPISQPALLAVALAELEGVLQSSDGELRAAQLPSGWDEGLLPSLESLWLSLFQLSSWDPLDGWRSPTAVGNPYPSACLLAFLLLAQLPDGKWARPTDMESWIKERHPFWQGEDVRPSRLRPWMPAFLLGLAFPMRFVEAVKASDGDWVVRLSPLGRWLLGLGEAPANLGSPSAGFQQTLLVQPNLEIVAYRQGLTPALIGRLARFATWKSLGAACILQLEPESVYRALESGLTFETIVQALEQHGTRATPGPVIESLRTWANKRDRISIYASAALLEFNSPQDLNEALARGVPATRLSDRLAVVADEGAIDFRHFRLTGSRDYSLPPEKCVDVADDGVTLSIDLARSDLLLETELPRFAELLERPGSNGRREYRMTPTSLAGGKAGGMGVPALESWFLQRTGQPLSPAARLLLTAAELPPAELRHLLVLQVATEELADGLMQWPETRGLIQERIGPLSLAVTEANAERLQQRMTSLGLSRQLGAEDEAGRT